MPQRYARVALWTKPFLLLLLVAAWGVEGYSDEGIAGMESTESENSSEENKQGAGSVDLIEKKKEQEDSQSFEAYLDPVRSQTKECKEAFKVYLASLNDEKKAYIRTLKEFADEHLVGAVTKLNGYLLIRSKVSPDRLVWEVLKKCYGIDLAINVEGHDNGHMRLPQQRRIAAIVRTLIAVGICAHHDYEKGDRRTLREKYTSMPVLKSITLPEAVALLNEFLALQGNALLHCWYSRDRTGVVAALLRVVVDCMFKSEPEQSICIDEAREYMKSTLDIEEYPMLAESFEKVVEALKNGTIKISFEGKQMRLSLAKTVND